MVKGESRWVEGLSEPTPLRTGTTFEVYSVRERGALRLLLIAHPKLDLDEAMARAERLAEAHEVLAGEHIPALLRRGVWASRPWLLLDAPAVVDGDELLRTQLDRGQRQPYNAAIGLLLRLSETLQRMHARVSKLTGRPFALGALGLANLYFSADGAMWLLGAGDNGFARAPTALPMVLAPEVALGESAAPSADGFALSALMRAMVPYVALPGPIERVLRGHDANTPLGVMVHQTNAQVWGLPHALRPSLTTLDRVFRGVLRLVGETPSYEAHCALVAELLRHDELQPHGGARPTLEVADDGSWFSFNAQPLQRLASRAALRRVLLCILSRAEQGETCDVWALLDAGWPGERVEPEAGANRVYVAVSSLRRMGLRDAIERFDAGYRLVPGVEVLRRQASLGPSKVVGSAA